MIRSRDAFLHTWAARGFAKSLTEQSGHTIQYFAKLTPEEREAAFQDIVEEAELHTFKPMRELPVVRQAMILTALDFVLPRNTGAYIDVRAAIDQEWDIFSDATKVRILSTINEAVANRFTGDEMLKRSWETFMRSLLEKGSEPSF